MTGAMQEVLAGIATVRDMVAAFEDEDRCRRLLEAMGRCHRNLSPLAKTRRHGSGSCLRCGSPSGECRASKDAEGVPGCEVALGVEGIVDSGMNRQKVLS